MDAMDIVNVSIQLALYHIVDMVRFCFESIRLSGRFAPIFYFNCEHVFFVYIVKQNKKYVDFSNFQKSNFVRGKFLKIRLCINLPWGNNARKVPQKIGPDRFSCFDVYLDSNGQTDKQTNTNTDGQVMKFYR